MSLQRYMSNSDQRSDRPMLEQLWYTWSTIGLGPLSAGFRIRAASQGLSDVNSPQVQALDRYLRYILPAGTDPFAITPDMAPICLSLIQTEQKEWILANKTYVGRDGIGRPGAFFVHLLCNLPRDFSAAQAITLWRSPFFRSSDIDPNNGVQLNGVQLDSISFNDLQQRYSGEIDILHPKGIHSSWVQDFFPLVMRAYLLWRKRWEQWKQPPSLVPQRQVMTPSEPPRLYIAAPSDMVAAFISGITRCLPPQLISDLTFSTYEYDVRSKGQVLLVGTAWPPSPEGKSNADQDLPASCYQEGVAINCYTYNEQKTQLEKDPLAISFTAYATQCLLADDFQELDWLFLKKTALIPNLDVSRFLQMYDSYIVKAQNPTQKDVELFIVDADADMLSKKRVQDLILTLALDNSGWLNDFLKPRLKSLTERSADNPGLADTLAQLAKAASQKATFAAGSNNAVIFNNMLSIMSWTADIQSEAWHSQPRILSAQLDIQLFLTNQPETHLRLLRIWKQLEPPLSIDEVHPFLIIQEPDFDTFYNGDFPIKWKNEAALALIESAMRQNTVRLLGKKYHDAVSTLLHHLALTSWSVAADLFEKLITQDYPDKISLLLILLDSSTSFSRKTGLLIKALPNDSEREEFLKRYGPRYLVSSQTEACMLDLLKVLAANAPTSKSIVFDSWLNSLDAWFATPSTGPFNLEKVLSAVSLTPAEGDRFIENYGEHYLKFYNQQYSSYMPSPLISGYLKHYLISDAISKSFWRTPSPTRDLLLFLGQFPLLLQSLTEKEQRKVKQWNYVWRFLLQPSSQMANVKEFGNILRELKLGSDPEFIERLARAFATCMESETELASLAYMMNTLIPKAGLLQMLFGMAEYTRNDLIDSSPQVQQHAQGLMMPYIRFALCFASIYDFSPEITITHARLEEKLFLQMLLRLLLQYTRPETIAWLDEQPTKSPLKYWQKWLDYKPQRSSTSTHDLLESSSEKMQIPRQMSSDGQSYNNLDMLLANLSTARKDLKALGDFLNNLISRHRARTSQLVEKLAEFFIDKLESETELTAASLSMMLQQFLKRSQLYQILYTVAETLRDGLLNPEKETIANHRLEPYIRFVLYFECICDLPPDEFEVFVRTFLNLLLRDAHTLQSVDASTKNWPTAISKRWEKYKPRSGTPRLKEFRDFR